MVMNEVFEGVVESTLQQPTFVMDHPIEISPLAKPHRSKPGCVERWELFIAGAELCSPYCPSCICNPCKALQEAGQTPLQRLVLRCGSLQYGTGHHLPESESRKEPADTMRSTFTPR